MSWFFSAVTPLSFSQYQIAPAVRATYHLGLQKNLDLYPLAFGGPVFARAKIELDDGSASYVGSDTGVQVGVGVGLSYFVAESFFVGFEARYRYARGTYAYEIQTGNGRAVYEGSGGSWSLSGFNVMFALGYRL